MRAFIDDLVGRHGMSSEDLYGLFARTSRNDQVLRLIEPRRTGAPRSWHGYRARMVDALRIREGIAFWNEHEGALARATARYGVPPEIIVAIIGIETVYGRNTGGFRIIEALATLAFDYPRRADYFRSELEQFLLYTRDAGLDAGQLRGSYAGAIGLPQFMPGSIRRYAADFDGDGLVDLRGNPADAIGSVARFLAEHGWQRGRSTHYALRFEPGAAVQPLIDAGIVPHATAGELRVRGVHANGNPDPAEKLALIDLPNGNGQAEFVLGANNFYVITRYNRSSFYAMAVIELALELARARQAQQPR